MFPPGNMREITCKLKVKPHGNPEFPKVTGVLISKSLSMFIQKSFGKAWKRIQSSSMSLGKVSSKKYIQFRNLLDTIWKCKRLNSILIEKSLFVSLVGLLLHWLMSWVQFLRFWNQAVDVECSNVKRRRFFYVNLLTEITLSFYFIVWTRNVVLMCHSFMYLIKFIL